MKETNMEHFRSEIEGILDQSPSACLALKNGVPMRCADMDSCDYCDFGNCTEWQKIKWLMSEYKLEPVLTAREKHFVEFAQEGWLVADIDGFLYWYELKPFKNESTGGWATDGECTDLYPVGYGTFKFIDWEDEEPWSVAELRKLKALEYNPEDVAFKGGGSHDPEE